MSPNTPTELNDDSKCCKYDLRSVVEDTKNSCSNFHTDIDGQIQAEQHSDQRCLDSIFRRGNFKTAVKVTLFALYNVYFGVAICTSWDRAQDYCEGVKFLTIITIISYISAFYSYIFRPYMLKSIKNFLLPFIGILHKISDYSHCSKIIWSAILIGIGAFLIVDTANERQRLISAAGILFFVLFGYLFSKHRNKIIWNHMLWGLTLQFIIGLIVLRWSVGRAVIHCLGNKIEALLEVSSHGSEFVFGYLVTGDMVDIPKQSPVFLFKCMMVLIFFGFLVSLFYYYGIMQIMVIKLGWLLQKTIGTTACESMNAAGNIFLDMNESPLLIRPYLPLMTLSELHAVMTAGFATVAGSGIAFYISFGIDATHLLTASVMSAPASLACSKLMYPETEESQTKAEDIKIEKAPERNVLQAATNGAVSAIFLIGNIAANLIAFIAFVTLLNTLLGWCGSLINCNDISFEWLMSKIFIPVSVMMGVDWNDKEEVANLVGIKTIVNEVVAYQKLKEYKELSMISERSAAIATYALCGFSNLTSIGIQLGSLSALAPDRKADLAQIAFRAMVAGTVTCLFTACVAGTLITQ